MSVTFSDICMMEDHTDYKFDEITSYLKVILFELKEMKDDDIIKLRKFVDGNLVETKRFSSMEEVHKYINNDISIINERQLILNGTPRTINNLPVSCVQRTNSTDVSERYRVLQAQGNIPTKVMEVDYYFI